MIETEQQYDNAIYEIDFLISYDAVESEQERFYELVNDVLEYEEKHYKIPEPTILGALEFYIDQCGVRRGIKMFVGRMVWRFKLNVRKWVNNVRRIFN